MTINQLKETGNKRISPYSDQELDYFRHIILKKRKASGEELEILKKALHEEMENASTKVTNTSHLADIGTNVRERDKIYILLNRTQKFISYLDRALKRIENRTYGICKVTGKKISQGRLEAVPHTQLSIEAKRRQK